MALISVSKAGSGKTISITTVANSNFVVYTVPPGKVFSGTITGNASGSFVTINNENVFLQSYVPFPVDLTAGTFISTINSSNSYSFNLLGLER